MTPRRPAITARLGGRLRTLVNLTGIGVWTTGVAWLALHYLLVKRGEFGPEQSPIEPWALKAHGAFAFLALWVGGLLWGVHVVRGWDQRRRRWSGGVALGGLLLLIVSGYLLYYVGAEKARAATSIAHWGLGLALPLAYLVHRLAEHAQRTAPARKPRPARPAGSGAAVRHRR